MSRGLITNSLVRLIIHYFDEIDHEFDLILKHFYNSLVRLIIHYFDKIDHGSELILKHFHKVISSACSSQQLLLVSCHY